jgi:predicted negative regulator of RcsB-dependent stress response
LTFLTQMYFLRREQRRLAEVAEPIVEGMDALAGRPLAGAVVASLVARLGRHDHAARAVDALAADGFAAIPRDNEWLLSLTLLADACVAIGDAQRSAALYELLLPFAGRIAISTPEGATGSVDHCLGTLAASLSRLDSAAGHFDAALRLEAAAGARPWVAHTQHARARTLLARGKRDEARALAATARATAQALGMTALAADAGSLGTSQ